ncbi:hypothetical protein SALBM135S_09247 [Streptomyces alboniger]
MAKKALIAKAARKPKFGVCEHPLPALRPPALRLPQVRPLPVCAFVRWLTAASSRA